MCNVEDEEVCNVLEKQNRNVDTSHCTKCGEESVIVLRVDDILCRNCFLPRVTHKFRAEFGKHHTVRANEEVLVAYSGGRKSAAMLHLMIEGRSKRAMKKLRFIPVLVHVIESLHGKVEDVMSSLEPVISQMKESSLSYYVYALEQVFCPELNPIYSSERESSNDSAEINKYEKQKEELNSLFDSTLSSTAKESLLDLLRRRLLLRAAQSRGKLVVGACTIDLAVRLISDVTQGRGSQVSQEMSFADTRDADVTVLRPMREFTIEEIKLYNELNNIRHIAQSTNSKDWSSSINKLCHQFVSELQEQHENTLSIIYRTGQKLTKGDEIETDEQNAAVCCLCSGPFDTKSSAMNATKFSESLCERIRTLNFSDDTEITPPINSTGSDINCGHVTSADENICLENSISREELYENLCYGCRLVIKDVKEINCLPSYCIDKARDRREQMKSSIQDFLISDDN